MLGNRQVNSRGCRTADKKNIKTSEYKIIELGLIIELFAMRTNAPTSIPIISNPHIVLNIAAI